MRYLKIDAVLVKERSLGVVTLRHPRLATFVLRAYDKADELVTIGEECVALKEIELLHTDKKKVHIYAPNVERVTLDNLTCYDREDGLVITARTAYTLVICRGAVHLE